MRAKILSKVPDLDSTTLIARNELSLVGVDDAVVDWRFMVKVPLNSCCPARPSPCSESVIMMIHEGTDLVSQIFKVPSSEPVTNHFPSQCQATAVTLEV